MKTGCQSSNSAFIAAAEHPIPASLDRLAYGCALKDELEDAWAAATTRGPGLFYRPEKFAGSVPAILTF